MSQATDFSITFIINRTLTVSSADSVFTGTWVASVLSEGWIVGSSVLSAGGTLLGRPLFLPSGWNHSKSLVTEYRLAITSTKVPSKVSNLPVYKKSKQVELFEVYSDYIFTPTICYKYRYKLVYIWMQTFPPMTSPLYIYIYMCVSVLTLNLCVH